MIRSFFCVELVSVSPSSLAKLSPKPLFVGSEISNDYSSTTLIQKCQRNFFSLKDPNYLLE